MAVPRHKLVSLYFGFAAICLSLACHAEENQPAIVFQSTVTPPIWTPELPDNGMGGEILKLLSAAAGIQASIQYLPVARFRRGKSEFILGDPDILLGGKRKNALPIALFRSALFYYKPHHAKPLTPSLKNLSGSRLGVLRGTLENKDYFVRHGITVEESDSTESLLNKLKKGRIGACILVELAGLYELGRVFADHKTDFAQTAIPNTVRPIALVFDADSAATAIIAERYQSVLDKVLAGNDYRAIIEKYYGEAGVPKDWFERLAQFKTRYSNK